MSWFAEAEQTVISRAKCQTEGIVLNRTSGINERIAIAFNTTSLIGAPMRDLSDYGTTQYRYTVQLALSFVINSLASTCTIYTSDRTITGGGVVGWVEVTTAGDMVAYWTYNTGGAKNVVTLATGITTNTLYVLQVFGGYVYLNGVLVYTLPDTIGGSSALLSIGCAQLYLGVRKWDGASTAGSTLSSGTTYGNYGSITFFDCATFRVLTNSQSSINQQMVVYNNGKGLNFFRHKQGTVVRAYYRFGSAYLSGAGWNSLITNTGGYPAAIVQASLVQSSYQSLQFKQRVGALVY